MNFTTVWGRPKDRKFGAGIDRGMVYTLPTQDLASRGEPWNGLVKVSVGGADGEFTTRYIDGIPFDVSRSPKDARGSIDAFTYPDIVEESLGETRPDGRNAIIATGQRTRPFHMSYRETLGYSGELQDKYIIHLLYGVVLQDSGRTHNTFTESRDPDLFSWSFLTTVRPMAGMRPTSYFKIDTRDSPGFWVRQIEEILYGYEGTTPSLPPISTFRDIVPIDSYEYGLGPYGYGDYGGTS